MSVHDYFLKSTKLSKYAPSLVSDPRDEMSRFMMGMSDDLKKECHLAMLHDNMNISHLMVHDQQVEETRSKRKSRDAKRSRSFDGGSSRVGVISKTSLRSRRGFIIKFLQNF